MTLNSSPPQTAGRVEVASDLPVILAS
ncbi:MAG: hypothetical protein QOK02_6331, partial [Mycobacterium sp.]|nr:hypothetical protein [Mycobacterium sp.]